VKAQIVIVKGDRKAPNLKIYCQSKSTKKLMVGRDKLMPKVKSPKINIVIDAKYKTSKVMLMQKDHSKC